jgi:rod shape-determining protein MreD
MDAPTVTESPRFRVPLVLLTCLVVHTTVLAEVRVLGVMPDLMLLVAVVAGITGGPVRGAAIGFASGLAVDLFVRSPMGLSALVFTLVGYAMGVVDAGVLRPSWHLRSLAAVMGSAGGVLLYAVVGAMLGEPLVNLRLLTVVAVVALANAVLAHVVTRLVAWSLAGGVSSDRLTPPIPL